IMFYKIISKSGLSLGQLLWASPFSLLLMVVMALSLKYRHSVLTWMDRQFFRESYNQETVLHSLVNKIRDFEIARLESLSYVSFVVSNEIERALHPREIFIFYREEASEDLRLNYAPRHQDSIALIANNSQVHGLLVKTDDAIANPLAQS